MQGSIKGAKDVILPKLKDLVCCLYIIYYMAQSIGDWAKKQKDKNSGAGITQVSFQDTFRALPNYL